METKELIQKKIVYWKKKLIDLSKRNNLISYRFTKSKSLKIISPEVSKIIESINNETKIRLLREKNEI